MSVLLDRMLSLGYVFRVFHGIQIDLNVVMNLLENSWTEVSNCDHNCTDEVGGYNCPAATTLNPGRKTRYAPTEKIISWLLTAREGLILARDQFLQTEFARYCYDFQIPSWAAAAIRENLMEAAVEVNLFGGNPELHPEIDKLIAQLRGHGFVVNLTTTGRRFMNKPDFVSKLLENPPNIIAASIDDVAMDELSDLVWMPLEELREKWAALPANHGQDQKGIEGMAMLRMAADNDKFPPVLINMVVHQGNLYYLDELMGQLTRAFPKVLLNPYPAQGSFFGEPGTFTVRDLFKFKEFVDKMIKRTLDGDPNVTKRIQYWNLMSSILETYANDPAAAANAVAGHGAWQCYKPGAGGYLQIGRRPKNAPILLTVKSEKIVPADVPGGHPGCYWNSETVTLMEQVSTPDQIRAYLSSGMQALAKQAPNRCPGCVMPRLMFSGRITELGMDEVLHPNYFRLRRQQLGF